MTRLTGIYGRHQLQVAHCQPFDITTATVCFTSETNSSGLFDLVRQVTFDYL